MFLTGEAKWLMLAQSPVPVELSGRQQQRSPRLLPWPTAVEEQPLNEPTKCPRPKLSSLSSYLVVSAVCVHFLIHRAGDRSPGPCGEPLEKAEVWPSAPNFTRVLLGHDDEARWTSL
ncbi:uncharacterized protein V6R79_008491 [Siganus canaliculatus]